MRCLIVLAGLVPHAAFAHGGESQTWLRLDPWVWVPMIAVAALYLRGLHVLRARAVVMPAARAPAVASFLAGYAALVLALIWPLDALGETSFAAHMAQHMVLIAVAAPLLALAQPAPVLLAALPSRLRRLNASLGPLHALARLRTAFVLHGILVWGWHAPLLFELALRWRWMHVLEHGAFLGSALLFWAAVRAAAYRGGEGCGVAALTILGTLMHTGLLGALLTFSPRLLYPFQAGTQGPGLSALEDQQLAGLLMWIPGSIAYLVAGLCVIAAWLRRSGTRALP